MQFKLSSDTTMRSILRVLVSVGMMGLAAVAKSMRVYCYVANPVAWANQFLEALVQINHSLISNVRAKMVAFNHTVRAHR